MGTNDSKNEEPVTIPKPKDINPNSTICNIIYKEHSGTGAIYGFEFPEATRRTLLITCNQVLCISRVDEVVGLRLEFKDDNYWQCGHNARLGQVALDVASRTT